MAVQQVQRPMRNDGCVKNGMAAMRLQVDEDMQVISL